MTGAELICKLPFVVINVTGNAFGSLISAFESFISLMPDCPMTVRFNRIKVPGLEILPGPRITPNIFLTVPAVLLIVPLLK
jgi:hypothetical protein